MMGSHIASGFMNFMYMKMSIKENAFKGILLDQSSLLNLSQRLEHICCIFFFAWGRQLLMNFAMLNTAKL